MLEYKFKKGDRVVVLPTASNGYAPAGATGTFNEYDSIHTWFYIDDEYKVSGIKHVCIEENDLELIEQSNKTAEEIAPTLFNAYKDILNEEALAALRQVIEDVENHEEVRFVDSVCIGSAFIWEDTQQGQDFWSDVDNDLCNKAEEKIIPLERNAGGNLSTKTTVNLSGDFTDSHVSYKPAPVKSDGGSSGYYKISVKLPQELYDASGNLITEVTFETQDLLYAMFYGEWSCSNVGKAARRIAEALQGRGKEGTSIAYDAKKIIWFGEDILKRFGKEK